MHPDILNNNILTHRNKRLNKDAGLTPYLLIQDWTILRILISAISHRTTPNQRSCDMYEADSGVYMFRDGITNTLI